MRRLNLSMLGASGAVVLVAAAILFAVGVARSQQEGASQKAAATKITIDNFSFTPGDLTVSSGTTITWVNHDDVPHTVVSDDKKFKSKALDTDDTFSFTFTQAGTYEYFCSLHPKMTAKVTVK